MSLATVPTTAPADDRKALMRLADKDVAVRVDDHGFITRVQRKITLAYGTELYAACQGEPKPDAKVQPFQPGYMRIVAAMGGQLLCPPTVKDAVTGQVRPNPLVETWPDGTVRRVTATALCAVRNPITGEWVVTVQTIVQDLETVLRQALLKMTENDDVVQIMAPDEWETRDRDKLKGWMAVPLAGAVLACNLKKAGVRDAWGTLLQQAATARQRTCSKAERLAADHNPITRMTWHYRDLRRDGAAAYADVNCIAWVEHTGRDEMARMLEQLATLGRAAGIDNVIDLPDEDADSDEPEDVLDEERPQITEQVEIEPAPARTAEPVRAEPPKAQPKEAPLTTDELVALDKLRSQVIDLEALVTPDALRALRELHGTHDVLAMRDVAALRTYRRALSEAIERGAKGAS